MRNGDKERLGYRSRKDGRERELVREKLREELGRMKLTRKLRSAEVADISVVSKPALNSPRGCDWLMVGMDTTLSSTAC